MTTDTLEKLCKRCGEHWPADAEFFYRVPARSDGLGSTCKACHYEMPSGQRKAAMRGGSFVVRSTWETLFPEYREGRRA